MTFTPFPKNFNQQVAENSILDYLGGRQNYLGNAFILNGTSTLAVGTEVLKFYISNPSTNSKGMFLYKTGITSGAESYVRYYLSPTITGNGTAATPVNMRPAYSTTSSLSCFTGPSASANGTLLGLTGSLGLSDESDALFVIDPGFSILVTVQAPGASGGSTVDVFVKSLWYEI